MALTIALLVLAVIIITPVFAIMGAIIAIHILEDYQMKEEYDYCISRDYKEGGAA